MSNAQRRSADEPPATVEEIRQAIADLTQAQLIRLRKYAYQRHGLLGFRTAGRNPEDLLSEALIAVLDGRRKWKKSSVDMLGLLLGTIKSMSSHMAAGKPADAFDELTPLAQEDDAPDPLDQVSSSTVPLPSDELAAIELDGRIRTQFRDDADALTIYEGFCEGMKPSEIRDCGFTSQQFDTAAKRLRRGINKMIEGDPR
jgi:DNA-directed RNA polymerase specialized sigma24 family protein